MKRYISVFLSLLVGSTCCTDYIGVGADRIEDIRLLKEGLLISEYGNDQYNIFEYNTNDDDSVNVLDLCRYKKKVLDGSTAVSQSIVFSCMTPLVSSDKSELTVPVCIQGNTAGISAFSFNAGYDRYFELEKVYSNYGEVSFSAQNGYVQFSSFNGENIKTEDKIVYLKFRVDNEVPYDEYKFYLDNIQGVMMNPDGSHRELTDSECRPYTDVQFFIFSKTEVTTVTTLETTTVSPVTTKENSVMDFSLDNARLSDDGKRLMIPVYMNHNMTGICAVNMNVEYDMKSFSLTGVSSGDYDGYGYVAGNRDNAVFNTYNSQNIFENSGIIAWLEFEVNDRTASAVYDFSLVNIKAYYSENWNQSQIPSDRYLDRSDKYRYSFETVTTTTPVTTTPVTTTSVTTTPVTTTPVTTTSVTTTPVTTTSVTTTSVTTTTTTTTTSSPPVEADYLESMEKEAVSMINSFRAENGVSVLETDELMCKAARIRANELARDFDSDRDPVSVFAEVGASVHTYSYIETATQSSASAIMNRIKISASDSFLKPSHERIGISHVYDSSTRYKHYWVVYIGS